jgi:hypothetical protein
MIHIETTLDMDKYWKIRKEIENLGYWCQIQSGRPDSRFVIFDVDYQEVVVVSGPNDTDNMERALQGLKNLANPTG